MQEEAIERQQLGQLMDPSTPAGKFMRELGITMEDARQLGIVSLLQNLPRKERTKYGKRKKLSDDEKRVLTKERNREHARSTRTRKKMILDALVSRLAVINRDSSLTTTALQQLNPASGKILENKRLCCVRELLNLCSNATGGRNGSSSSSNISDRYYRTHNGCNNTTLIWNKCITVDPNHLPFRLTFPALSQQLQDNSTNLLEGFGTQGAINVCSVLGKGFAKIVRVATMVGDAESDDCLNIPASGSSLSSSLMNC